MFFFVRCDLKKINLDFKGDVSYFILIKLSYNDHFGKTQKERSYMGFYLQ